MSNARNIGWGATPTGFIAKPVQQLITETTGELLGLIDPTTDLSPDQPPGQLIGIVCKKVAELWQVGAVSYNATNRGAAEGDLLDNIGTLTGTERAKPSPSTVQCTATFSTVGTYPAGSLVCHPPGQPTIMFANVNAIVVPAIGGDGVNAISATNTWPSLSGAIASLTATGPYLQLTDGGLVTIPVGVVGQSITISGSVAAANNGTFTIAIRNSAYAVEWAEPIGAATDGSGHVTWLINPQPFLFASIATGPDAGDALAAANAAAMANPLSSTYGAPFGQLNVMTPVAGWTSVADAGAVSIGTLEELDPPYRVRQFLDLSAPGSDTLDATVAAVLLALQNAPLPVPGASVQPYENTTLVTDGNGLPGKSYRIVVYDGATPNTGQNNPLIAAAIWRNHPAGIQDYGVSAPVLTPDSQGVLRAVYFDRPAARGVTLSVTPYVSAATLANPAVCAALQGAIATAITNAAQGLPFTLYGNVVTPGPGSLTTLVPGNDVVAEAFRAIAQGQTGVIDAQPTGATLLTITVGGGPPLASGNVGMTVLQYGVLNAVVAAPALFNPAA